MGSVFTRKPDYLEDRSPGLKSINSVPKNFLHFSPNCGNFSKAFKSYLELLAMFLNPILPKPGFSIIQTYHYLLRCWMQEKKSCTSSQLLSYLDDQHLTLLIMVFRIHSGQVPIKKCKNSRTSVALLYFDTIPKC